MNNLLINNLEKAEFINKPFKYSLFQLLNLETNNKLINNFYRIIDNLKNKKTNNKSLSSSRFMIELFGDTENGINYKNYEFLKKIEPLNSILLEYQDNIIKTLIKKYNLQEKKNYKYCIMLVYDKKNYLVGPHTDSFFRAVTQVTYIVHDNDSDKKLGVKIYKDKINIHKKEWLKKHYDLDDTFEELKQIDYYPGSTINFKVSKNSFHGVTKINQDCERMSIQMYIFK